MAKQNKTQVLKDRPNKVVSNIVRASNARARRDIAQWTQALRSAENVDNPKRALLYNIYKDILLDAHLSSEIEKRANALTGASFALYDESGKPVPEATDLLKNAWFNKFLLWAFESRLWGHSLMEVDMLTQDGKVGSLTLVNRWHVIPEKGMVVNQQGEDKGTLYRGNPTFEPWLFEVGDNYDLGLLNKAVPHVLYKRFAQGAWSEFCEIFGVPPRFAKTAARDNESLNRLENMMVQMGVANYAVINKDEEIEFLEPSKSDGSVFLGLMNYSAAEISKLINGAVIGEESQGGSRAKEEVGLEVSNGIWDGDKAWLEGIINEQLIPKLVAMGYPFTGLSFEFSREKNLQAEWKIVSGILNHFEVEPEYIKETFGVPVIKQKIDGLTPNINTTASGTGFFD